MSELSDERRRRIERGLEPATRETHPKLFEIMDAWEGDGAEFRLPPLDKPLFTVYRGKHEGEGTDR